MTPTKQPPGLPARFSLEVGVAASFPVPFLDPAAKLDAGVFGQFGAQAKGSTNIGTGRVAKSFGLAKGDVQGLAGKGAELTAMVPTTAVPVPTPMGPVPVPNPLGPSTGGSIDFDESGSFSGAKASEGFGAEVSASGTFTEVVSVRDLLGMERSAPEPPKDLRAGKLAK
jgi:hypothetical protein